MSIPKHWWHTSWPPAPEVALGKNREGRVVHAVEHDGAHARRITATGRCGGEFFLTSVQQADDEVPLLARGEMGEKGNLSMMGGPRLPVEQEEGVRLALAGRREGGREGDSAPISSSLPALSFSLDLSRDD
jgi:hypothetical protein